MSGAGASSSSRAVEHWFLTSDERGNPDTVIDTHRRDGRAWSEGNLVQPLIHGAAYFKRLRDEMARLRPGDWIHFTDWRGDADERLDGEGSEVGTLLCELARRGVKVRALVWRSHPDQTSFSEQENLHLAEMVNKAGGQLLLDERVRRGGSHHQKLFLFRYADRPGEDVAFVGGIDLCHGRNDDERHTGDPQVFPMDARYGERPAWHDVQVELRGPAVNDLAATFRERWEDPTPLDHRNPFRKLLARRSHEPDEPGPLPELPPDPPAGGPHAVQVLRTYPRKRPPYPFAREGERSIARAYRKVLRRARRLIYLEDQYLWSEEVAGSLADALSHNDDLHLIAVVPRFPDRDGRVTGPPNRMGQQAALDMVRRAGGERVAVFNIENEAGYPIYVHAKVCVIDDVWCAVGSDNLNRRSWTHDSELSCAILDETLDEREPRDPAGLGDGARTFPRDLRLTLWREHLGRQDDEGLVDFEEGFAAWRQTAEELDGWYRSGRFGPRPSGRVRLHEPGRVKPWAAWWAYPFYKLAVDPDGRPRSLQKSGDF